ncbi:MAG: hypothetical protein H7332_10505 [Bdellovibrionales bacterium]|nr:hypothetical protein [Ramlibacter sp.]
MEIAPTYIADVVRNLLQIITEEAAFEAGVKPPEVPALMQELGWVLHGNISHLGIRRHVYKDTTSVPVDVVVEMHVTAFLASIPLLCKR